MRDGERQGERERESIWKLTKITRNKVNGAEQERKSEDRIENESASERKRMKWTEIL